MNITVAGLGMVSKIGCKENLELKLTKNSIIASNDLPSNPTLPIDFPEDSNISPQLIRRMSHFAKISLRSAYDALRDANLDPTGKSVGIIQGSVYGPIISGIQSFDDLIDFGDNQLSPTNFSGSVFNASATYLSLVFGIQGPTLTHTSGQDTLYNSLLTSYQWLESGTVDYVLMGIGDEYTTYFDTHGTIKGQSYLLPTGEGWTTFILSKDEKAKYGTIEYGSLKILTETKNEKNIYSVWHEQINLPEYLNHSLANQACFPVNLRGSYPSAAAFDLALALICKKTGRFPVFDAADGSFQIFEVDKERINCYCKSENNGWFYYRVL